MDGVYIEISFSYQVPEGKHKQVGLQSFKATHIKDLSFDNSYAHGTFHLWYIHRGIYKGWGLKGGLSIVGELDSCAQWWLRSWLPSLEWVTLQVKQVMCS